MEAERSVVQIPGDLLAVIDELVGRGAYESRAEVVRAGIEALAELDRRTNGVAVDAYPQTLSVSADRAALASLRDAILEEPW